MSEWETIKPRRRNRPVVPDVKKHLGKAALSTAASAPDTRSEEEVVAAFEGQRERWWGVWGQLRCGGVLGEMMGVVRGDLGIGMGEGAGEGREDKGEGERVREKGEDKSEENTEEKRWENNEEKSERKAQEEEKTEEKPEEESEQKNEETSNKAEETTDEAGKSLPASPDAPIRRTSAEPEEPTEQSTSTGPSSTAPAAPAPAPAETEGKKPRRRASGLSHAVCLGLGTFEGEGWDSTRRTWMQYFAFLAIVEALDPTLPTLFQDPAFTQADKTFLASRGHTVVESPAAFEAVAADPAGSVVVGFHLYVPVYRQALGWRGPEEGGEKEGEGGGGEGETPRVFVGTGWDDWDRVNKGDELPALKKMHATYRSEPLPQDQQAIGTFSSTRIYWLPSARAGSK
ncbi:uncharacterized protein DNG_09984 [Cephalotrichum gorgonifer]|uniref:SRR1-like domain-containing protein n=1 Tax=Cephalotrichum gorgonifer TaxID=2041049 RepID=A0AAE8SZX4_9PEZI|nr:uncharacterized protein DNG_09984 [Cephalotrichum gorgonifer]